MKRWLLALLFLSSAVAPVFSQSSDFHGVKGTIEINAPPERVWTVVHEQRATDPDLAYSKIIQQKNNRLLIEQKYNALPIIGEATCLLVQEETPVSRIDYKMVRSDKFKDMSGSWILQPSAKGTTILELQSLLDTGLPYSQGMINSLLQEKINKRLVRIKNAAEVLGSTKSAAF